MSCSKVLSAAVFVASAGIPAALCAPAFADDAKPGALLFGVYTSDKPSEMLKQFKPIVDYLEHRLEAVGVASKVELKVYPGYRDAIDALVKGKCDFVRFGPASYINAKEQNPDLRLIAMEHEKGEKIFHGIFITAKDSPIHSLKDLKGRTFAFGDEESTIGRYLSQSALLEAGIKASDLKSYKHFDRHDQVALVVAVGNYDAGVVKQETFEKYAESKGLREIGRFPNVTKPWVARSGFPEPIFQALKQALLECKDKEILGALKQDGFLEAADADYDMVRKGMDAAKNFERN